jgi:hypothetical protein
VQCFAVPLQRVIRQQRVPHCSLVWSRKKEEVERHKLFLKGKQFDLNQVKKGSWKWSDPSQRPTCVKM